VKQTTPPTPDSTPDSTPAPSSENAPTYPSERPPQAPPQRPADESIKETFESIVIAFILAFVFRAYVVEAFVIPTGSMAPTLLGAHYRAHCDQCGYEFNINYSSDSQPRDPWANGTTCTMCRYNINMQRNARPSPGDRILVHKYVYSISEPRRWDVIVFKAPHDPNQNFIKRLVGLPNESIRLLDGNLYTRAEGEAKWKIARKSDRPKVQRAVWQPVYHSQYIPRDGGRLTGSTMRDAAHRWKVPWVTESGDWDIENRRSYRFNGGGTGKIGFDFNESGYLDLSGVYPYNQYDRNSFRDKIEDIRLSAAIQPEAQDCTVSLSTQTRLNGDLQPRTVTASIQADGTLSLNAQGRDDALGTAQASALTPGQSTTLELWAVDQELSVWVDGERLIRYLYADELSDQELFSRPPPKMTPRITIEVSGGPVTLHRVELDRVLYYASRNFRDRARGGLVRLPNGTVNGFGNIPLHLEDEEFFCIGDNSPLSDDGRFWGPSNSGDKRLVYPHAQWIRQLYFGSDPDDPSRDGIVPGKLIMGRAFFVYFPAPYAWSATGRRVIPNFADMRFIH